MKHYKNYIGQYVKRFYTPFKEENIYQIKDYRIDIYNIHQYLYSRPNHEFWTDCEDSCIITNELPILDINWVANVNSEEYNGFNPFK
jgi:hypothetical protein